MKFDTTQVNFFNGCITIPIPKHLGSALQALIAAVSKGKVLQVQITIKRKQRSLDANAYLWALLGEMARVLYTDKDELYLQMLERYGVFTHIIVRLQEHFIFRSRKVTLLFLWAFTALLTTLSYRMTVMKPDSRFK